MLVDQLAKITGVPAKTIRQYESVGLLVPEYNALGEKEYHDSHIHALKLIKMAKSVGFSLREILTVVSGQTSFNAAKIEEAVGLLNAKLDSLTSDATNYAQHKQTIDVLKRELESFQLSS